MSARERSARKQGGSSADDRDGYIGLARPYLSLSGGLAHGIHYPQANVRAPRLTRFVGPDKPLAEAGERHASYLGICVQRSRVQLASRVPAGDSLPNACHRWRTRGAGSRRRRPWVELSRSSVVQIARLLPARLWKSLLCW